MRRIIACLMLSASTLVLSACGKQAADSTVIESAAIGEEIQTNIFEETKILREEDFLKEMTANKVAAEDTYIGNKYQYTGKIESIENDHIIIRMNGEIATSDTNERTHSKIQAYLPAEDIKTLVTESIVTIAGNVTKIGDGETTVNGIPFPLKEASVTLEPAYVSNEFVATGEIKTIRTGELISGAKPLYTGSAYTYFTFRSSEGDLSFDLGQIVENYDAESETVSLLGQEFHCNSTITVTAQIIGGTIEKFSEVQTE